MSLTRVQGPIGVQSVITCCEMIILDEKFVAIDVVEFDVDVETALGFHFLLRCGAGLVFLFVQCQGLENAQVTN